MLKMGGIDKSCWQDLKVSPQTIDHPQLYPQLPPGPEKMPLETKTFNALWQSGDMGEKCNKKVVNFGNWFLCQFSPKTYKFLHGASLTPQKSGDEKNLKNMDKQGEKKAKNVKGVFFTDKTGLNLILSQKEFFFVKQTFVKNTP